MRWRIALGVTGFLVAFSITLAVLKLTKIIDWSWWWVISPVWLLACAAVGTMIGVALATLLIAVWDWRR